MKHSLFSASAADRWGNCPGSLAVTRGLESTTSAAAQEGTAGHALADLCLQEDHDPTDYIGVDFEGVTITDDLALAVQVYVEYVRGLPGTKIYEGRVYYAPALGIEDEEQAFGTADCIVLDGTTVTAIDLKLGRIWVPAERNRQLTLYAAGMVHGLEEVGETVERIEIHIVQPRVTRDIRPYVYTRAEFDEVIAELRWAAKTAKEGIKAYDEDGGLTREWVDRYLFAGEAQCQWCPFAGNPCPALTQSLDDLFPSEEPEDPKDYMKQLAEADLVDVLERLPLVEILAKAARSEAFARLSNGEDVHGFKLVLGREGHRRWKDPKKAIKELLKLGAPEEAVTKTEIRTPPQLERELKKLKLSIDMDELIVRNPAKPTLAHESDPREPWSGEVSKDEFD